MTHKQIVRDALKGSRREFWDDWHSGMSKEQFNADPTIEDIDAAIDALEHLIDKAELIERLEAAKENLDREFKTEEVPLYYGGINDGIDKAITIIKELGE